MFSFLNLSYTLTLLLNLHLLKKHFPIFLAKSYQEKFNALHKTWIWDLVSLPISENSLVISGYVRSTQRLMDILNAIKFSLKAFS